MEWTTAPAVPLYSRGSEQHVANGHVSFTKLGVPLRERGEHGHERSARRGRRSIPMGAGNATDSDGVRRLPQFIRAGNAG